MEEGTIRQSAEEMDEIRERSIAYQYLCHLEEARLWLEAVLRETLPPTTDLEESLRNGVYLAKLANIMSPVTVPMSRIYDVFQHRYKAFGLQFRHTDNINYWIKALNDICLPKTFHPETTDVYDKKNMPKVIYCIHALSTHLFRLGKAPQIQDLYGKLEFSRQDIDNVCEELKKYGVSLPAFQKIGGLLAADLDSDGAALHAAVIQINEALDKEDKYNLISSLKNPAAGLEHVNLDNIELYLQVLSNAKETKCRISQNKTLDESYEPDIYDELLIQAEIQGFIRKANREQILQSITVAIAERDKEGLKQVLASSSHEIRDVSVENINIYSNELLKIDVNNITSRDKEKIIESTIKLSNQKAKEAVLIKQVLFQVQKVLSDGTPEQLYQTLDNPYLKLSPFLNEMASSLYFEEMKADFETIETLCVEVVTSSVTVLNNIFQVTVAVDSGDFEMTWRSLARQNTYFMDLDPTLKLKYFTILSEVRHQKLSLGALNPILTFSDIQECIDLANSQDNQQARTLTLLEEINEAVRGFDMDQLSQALHNLVPGEMNNNDTPLYMYLLQKIFKQKQSNGEGIWLDDVVSVVQDTHSYNQEVKKVIEWLIHINTAIINNEKKAVLKALEDKQLSLPSDETMLLNSLKDVLKRKESVSKNPWICYNCKELPVYLNLKANTYQWSKPKEMSGSSSCFLSFIDVQNIISQLTRLLKKNSQEAKQKEENRVEYLIILLQAHARGFLVRQRVKKIQETVVKIQAWWRGVRARRIYATALLQRQEKRNLGYYRQHIHKIIKIQAWWRGYYTRRMDTTFAKQQKLTLPVLRRMLPRLKAIQEEYSTDLQIQNLKSQVVKTVKRNQELGRQLEEMDIKIGLLVQNRISFQAIVHEKNKLTAARSGNVDKRGLRHLNKETKVLFDGYQKLFYLLQTNPAYLSRLLIHLPSNQTKKLIQNCILVLFNYGSIARDSYLLLRLFRAALNEEFNVKFQKPLDAVTDNSLVLKLAVGYAREADGQSALRNILGPVIEKVLDDKDLFIDTNPVDVYRRWVNQVETETGRASELPHSVTQEQALQHPEVVVRLNNTIHNLKEYVKCFLNRLSSCFGQLPYALRFIAKSLRDALHFKFPQTPEKEILKIVGHFLYYQYINTAIIAPDAFHIISLPPGKNIQTQQRRNLASIAKILQFAAAKKGFGEESIHLVKLNSFIIDCHEEMKRFCTNCCNIDDLQNHFRITEYSEAELTEKPRVYITMHEILECHKLFLDQRNILAPDALDPIHEILDDLGPLSGVYSLLGWSPDDVHQTKAKSTEVCLELESGCEQVPQDLTENEKLFIKTKEMIINRLNTMNEDNLVLAVQHPQHRDIARNLDELEAVGMVRSGDGYNGIIQSIAADISKKDAVRQAQYKELKLLRSVLHRLDEKRQLYEEKVAYYDQYILTCINTLAAPKRKDNKQKQRTVKYSGARLREKGVLVALDGIPQGQLKNIQFDITTTEANGIFSVRGRFLGVEVEKLDIDIQDLLRLQYEGRAVMDLFGKAQINVNLLLHLLNKKFYSRP